MFGKIMERFGANVEVGKAMADDYNGGSSPGLSADNRANKSAMQVVALVVALTVGAIVAAFLLPIGLSELSGAELGDNASSGAVALWGILDVIIVLAVFLFFIGVALAAVDRI